jgi:hypothetical protein
VFVLCKLCFIYHSDQFFQLIFNFLFVCLDNVSELLYLVILDMVLIHPKSLSVTIMEAEHWAWEHATAAEYGTADGGVGGGTGD